MNKKLIALAVAGACVAPEAMAQTANPVTLYGRVYAMLSSVEAKSGATPVVRRNRVDDQSSLLGVRGTEDLGGGLKAFFQLETAFKPDQNDSTFAGRNSGVGLQGAWGSVLLGRWDTPFKTTTIAVDPFGDLTLGGIEAALQGNGVGGVNSSNGFDRRDQNVVQYWSPTWAGLAFRASYMANEGRTATANPRSNGASLTYTAGPIYAGYAYHELKDLAYYGSALSPKQTANAVFGTFTFGPLKFGAAYEEFKRDQPGGAANNVCAAPTGFVSGTDISCKKQKAWLGNITWTIGNNQLMFQYQDMKDGMANNATTQPHCKVASGAWQYNFSRRTFFHAQYTKIDNNETSQCNFGAVVLSIANGQDPHGVQAGIRHIF